ncbi:MAG: hypothetical protein IPO21_03290 [Bacteroidales bacterium]|nr:hypothetical protein [Bacteroidales bacterium]
MESSLKNTLGCSSCVIQMGTPEVVEAAFTRNRNHFNDAHKEYWKPLVRLDKEIDAAGHLFEYFKDILNLTKAENDFATKEGFAAMNLYTSTLKNEGAKVLNDLVENNKIGVLVIGRNYHNDTGLNHGIPEEFQILNFPVIGIESLPDNDEFLEPLFRHDASKLDLDVKDVWVRNFNRNTNIKIWAAKVAARHPNLAVIDLSSFKCGHDAPTYSYIDKILDASETPLFVS